jgi:hypothetical protein
MLVVPTQPDRVNGSTTAPAAAVNATATQHSLSGVMLHEARRQLGGRARSTGPPFVASDGPHDLYADGITWRFLHDRRVAVPMARPPAVAAPGSMVRGRIRRVPRAMPGCPWHASPGTGGYRLPLVGDPAMGDVPGPSLGGSRHPILVIFRPSSGFRGRHAALRSVPSSRGSALVPTW